MLAFADHLHAKKTLYNTLQERENPKKHNRAPLIRLFVLSNKMCSYNPLEHIITLTII